MFAEGARGDGAMEREHCTHTIPQQPSEPGVLVALAWVAVRGLGEACRRVADIGLTWTDRARQRRQLTALSDHMLRDIGWTRADAWAEADKPFWLAPALDVGPRARGRRRPSGRPGGVGRLQPAGALEPGEGGQGDQDDQKHA